MISKALVTLTVALLLFSLSAYKVAYVGANENTCQTRDYGVFYDMKSTLKTFEDLFLPHWFENCTLSFKVPEYMHHFNLAFATIWAKGYQYGYETGREAKIVISDNEGNVYLDANNSASGSPVGGSGQYPGAIKGDELFINVTGKIYLQLGVWGDWTENILNGGTYSLTFNAGKIALYMDYYNPTNFNTFYFKSSKPVYAYLIASNGVMQSSLDKPATKGALKEKYDSAPFLTFVRPKGVEGNITIQFWAGYEEKKSDPAGALVVLGIAAIIFIGAYLYSKRSIYGTKRRNKR